MKVPSLALARTGVIVAAAILGGGHPAVMADPILPGFDLYETLPGSNLVFGPTSPIPSGFFGPGSDPFVGTVALGGLPIGPGLTDTVVQRMDPGPPSGGSGPINIELVALNLVSVMPITVTFNGGSTSSTWDVAIGLQPTPDSLGTIQVGHNDPSGGIFISGLLNVNLVLTFTETMSPFTMLQTNFSDTLTVPAAPATWSHTAPPQDAHNLAFPAGNLYSGPITASSARVNLLLGPAAVPEAGAWLMLGVAAAGVGGVKFARQSPRLRK